MTGHRDQADPDDLGRQVEQLRRQVEQLRQQRDQIQQERDRLQQEHTDLQKQHDRLQRQRDRLQERVRKLEQELEACQRASHRQAAPFRRHERLKVPKDQQKRPGRRRGHAGRYRPVPDLIDERVEVPLPCCPHCGRSVDRLRSRIQYIEEIPPLRPRVTQVITYQGGCPQCGPVESLHPLQCSRAQGSAQTQLGPRALAMAAELNKGHGLSMRQTCRILERFAGLRLSPGGLSQALDRAADRLASHHQSLVQQLRRAPAVFADETSWWVGEPGWWLWTFTTPHTTLYVVDSSRGSQVVKRILGAQFSGTLVSDCLASYDPPDYRKHKCIGHHLKAIAQARDRPDTADSPYLQQWRTFLKTVSAVHALLVERPQRAGKLVPPLEQWRDRLLAHPPAQPGDLIIYRRLHKQRPHLLGCLYNTAAEPTNNRAERALRPAVIARKISCGNKTVRGKRTWETLVSLTVSWKQQGLDAVEILAQALPLTR